jgi:hypothetical protein
MSAGLIVKQQLRAGAANEWTMISRYSRLARGSSIFAGKQKTFPRKRLTEKR